MVSIEQISHIVRVFPLFTLNKQVPAGISLKIQQHYFNRNLQIIKFSMNKFLRIFEQNSWKTANLFKITKKNSLLKTSFL